MGQHQTFGGSRLDRHVFDFEPAVLPAGDVNLGNFREGSDAPYAAVLDSLGLNDAPPTARGEPAALGTPIQQAVAAPADPYATPSPTATTLPVAPAAPPAPAATDPYASPAPVEPATPAEPVPAWATDLQTTVAQLAQILPNLGAPAAPLEPAPAELDFDTASGAEIRAYLDQAVNTAREESAAYVAQQFESRLGPVLPLLDTVVQERAQAAATQHFEQLQGQVGRFDADSAYVRARALMAEHPQADPAQVLMVAAQQQHEHEKKLWTEFQTLRGTTAAAVVAAPPATPVAPAAASEIRPVHQGPDRYEAAKNDFFARRNVQPVTA